MAIEKKHISIEKVNELIGVNNPRLVFVVGKTCTGKSTFATNLVGKNYTHLELDSVVLESVIKKFGLSDRDKAFSVYKGIANVNWQSSFERASLDLIKEKIKESKIIVDAAFSDPGVLKRIVPSEYERHYYLIYFHPLNIDLYYKGILNRLVADMETKTHSFPIWNNVGEQVLDDFKTHGEKGGKLISLVREYGDESIKKSVERFKKFEKVFPNIILTGY